jgi:DMSO/TMAO reductase YedYZ molybdopterin-dependent catalytic subunit
MRYLKSVLALVLTVAFLAGCTQSPAATQAPATTAPAATAPAAASPAAATSDVALQLTGLDGKSKSLTMDDLKKMTAVQGWAGIKSSTGKITLPTEWKGVAITDLIALVGAVDDKTAASLVAKDGYAMTFSSDQLLKSAYTYYDPATGDEITPSETPQTIIAYEMDGKPIDPETDGPLKLVVISPKNDLVVDGHWCVKWVTKIELKNLAAEWSVMLHGAVKENMERASFESCAAPKCHGATWTDDKGQVWSGVPLWLLTGAVDDETKHGTGAYNEALATKGYNIDLVASDDYTATLDSATVKRNDKIIVAYLLNGNPLGEDSFPLALVGPDLTKKQMVTKIARIELALGGESQAAASPTAPVEATAAPSPAAESSPAASTGGAAFSVSGAVEDPLSLSLDDLKAMNVVKITAEQPKKGTQEFQGVRLSDLLAQAKVKSGATTILFTASDDYTAEVALSELADSPDAMIAIGEDGKLSTVMPNLPGNSWVKDVVKAELR